MPPMLFKTGYLPIGVDIGASGAWILQLRRRKQQFSLVDTARVDLTHEQRDLPEDQRLEAILQGVRRKIEAGEFAGVRCAISIGDDLVRVRSVRQPRMSDEEADRAIRLEATERLGFSEDDPAQVGWLRAGQVRKGDARRDEVIVLGASRNALERLVDGAASVGLRPIAVEPSFISCARCFARTGRRSSDQCLVRLLIDVGWRTTGVIVTRGRRVAFYKSLTIGGDDMNQAVAERLSLDLSTAADLRRQRMKPSRRSSDAAGDPRTDRAMFDAVRPILENLAHEISLCLRYYSVTFSGQRPQLALAVGGEACEPGLVDHLAEALSVPSRVGQPLEHVDLAGTSLGAGPDRPHTEWVNAAGLSLRGTIQATSAPGDELINENETHGERTAAKSEGENRRAA